LILSTKYNTIYYIGVYHIDEVLAILPNDSQLKIIILKAYTYLIEIVFLQKRFL